MPDILDQFLNEHTSQEDPLLDELFRQTHTRFVNPNMACGHFQGKLLELISYMIRPSSILEIGTFTGYSAICLAKGLQPGGTLTTIEINDELQEFAGSYFSRAGMAGKIIQMTGKAQDIIPDLDVLFDLVFIDGDKREYVDYFNIVRPKIRLGGFIIVDNVLWGGKALEKESKDQQLNGILEFNKMIKNNNTIDKIILPVRDGIMLIRIIE
jgi:caffeoyl-CoA O-methyltransferase